MAAQDSRLSSIFLATVSQFFIEFWANEKDNLP